MHDTALLRQPEGILVKPSGGEDVVEVGLVEHIP